MRENETILIANACYKDNDTAISDDVAYMTFNAKHLPKDAGIKVSNSGRSFKASNITTTSLLHCIFILYKPAKISS